MPDVFKSHKDKQEGKSCIVWIKASKSINKPLQQPQADRPSSCSFFFLIKSPLPAWSYTSMHCLRVTVPGQNMLQEKGHFSSRKAPRLPVPQLSWNPWTTTFCYAISPHCNGKQIGRVLDLSWQPPQPHRNHSPALGHAALPYFFLCAGFDG